MITSNFCLKFSTVFRIDHMFKFLFLIIFSFNAYSQCQLHFNPFESLNGSRKLENVKELKIASYNVFNLQFSPGKFTLDPKTGTKVFTPRALQKDPVHTREIANIILREDLDIVVLQEVEGFYALKHFNINFLGNKYHELVMVGNDTRGIEIAFLIKKDLGLKYKLTTNKHILSSGENPTPLFSRDLPILHIWPDKATGTDPPSLILMGNHLKSQRDRSGDVKSVRFRTEQVEKIVEITQHYQNTFPTSPIILAGDFNADLRSGSEFRGLFQDGLYKDAFDLGEKPLPSTSRITHTYHPHNGSTVYNQLDGFLVNGPAQTKVKSAKVYRYLADDGTEKPIPLTYDQRDQNPSDHFPIIMKFTI